MTVAMAEYQTFIQAGAMISEADYDLLVKSVESLKPLRVVEVGSFDGGTAALFGTLVKPHGGEVYCVDPFLRQRFEENVKAFGLEDTVRFVQEAAPWMDCGWLAEAPVDLLFINGCHWLRWVLSDYHFFEPFVRQGGLIIFHDYSLARGHNEVYVATQIIRRTDPLTLLACAPPLADGKKGLAVFRKDRPRGVTLKTYLVSPPPGAGL